VPQTQFSLLVQAPDIVDNNMKGILFKFWSLNSVDV